MASPPWLGSSPHSSTGGNKQNPGLTHTHTQQGLCAPCGHGQPRPHDCIFCFSAFLVLQSVPLAWTTLRKCSRGGSKNRKPQTLFGQRFLKTKYQNQGKEKRQRLVLLNSLPPPMNIRTILISVIQPPTPTGHPTEANTCYPVMLYAFGSANPHRILGNDITALVFLSPPPSFLDPFSTECVLTP